MKVKETSDDKSITKAYKRRLRRLKRIGRMLERGLREDAIISLIRCTAEDIFEARKLLNTEATPETKEKSRLDTLALLESRGELNEFHLYAAEEIYLAIKMKTDEVRCRTISLETRVDISGHRPYETDSERSVRLQQQYDKWWANCYRSGIDINACLYVIEEQVALAESDRHFSRRNGHSKKHLILGLERYCFLFHPSKGYRKL